MPRPTPTTKSSGEKVTSRHYKPRQEISLALKYLLFVGNFLFALSGLVALGLGVYLYSQDPRGVSSLADLLLNPSIVIMGLGLTVFGISLMGCMGALREAVALLKAFALSIFVAYILLVIVTFLLFLLFYSQTGSGVSIRSLLMSAVAAYAENPNWRDLMDWLHSALECCGATERGYKDWGLTAVYNCSQTNPLPEACGVPPSCCYPAQASSRHVQCWRDAQLKSITELQTQRLVRTEGCLAPLQAAFEGHAVIIGAIIGSFILPVCLGVMLSNVLGKQVEKQRYLLDREAKREEKRRRRAKHRFRDPFAATFSRRRQRATDGSAAVVDETRELSPPPNQGSPSGPGQAVPAASSPTAPASGQQPTIAELRVTHLTQDMLKGGSGGGERRKQSAQATSAAKDASRPRSSSAAGLREPSKAAASSAEPPVKVRPGKTRAGGPHGRIPPPPRQAPRRRGRSRDPSSSASAEPPNASLKIVEITDDDDGKI